GAGASAQHPSAADPLRGSGDAPQDPGGLGRVETEAAGSTDLDDWTRAEGPRLNLRVLDLFSHEPIPGAELWVFDPDHYDRAELRAALEETHDDWEPLAKTFARHARADENGEVSLPQPQDWFRILGRSESRYGELYHPQGPDGQKATLYLETDHSLRVLVTDARDQPLAGFPIRLREQNGDWSSWSEQRTTNEQGRAAFSHLQETLGGGNQGARMFLAASIPLKEGPEIEISLDEVPAEEQILVIPAFGNLRVSLFDADHRPFEGKARVMVQGAWEADLPDWYVDEGFQELASHGSHTIDAEGSEAFFPYVGVGEPLTVAVDFDGTENWESVKCSGPDAAGVTATVDVSQQVLRPSFLVRLLDADGQPLRDTAVLVQDRFVSSSWSDVSSEEERTDDDGRLWRTIGEDWMENQPGSRRWIEFVREAEEGDSAAIALGARIEGRADWRVGVNDLGDVKLAELPWLAIGRVVDAAGVAVAHADVALSQRFQRSRGRDSWRSERDTRTLTDRDGLFRIRGFSRDGTFRLEARHRDYALAFVPWVAGEQEHLLEFTSGLFVTGQILRDPAAANVSIRVQLVEQGSTPESTRVRSQGGVKRSGTFRCGPGAPELSELWVCDENSDRVLWRVLGVQSHELSATPDSRLDPLDLRGKLRVIQVDCRTPEGREVTGDLNYALTSSVVEKPEDWQWAGSGHFGFLAGEEPLHLWIRGEEYKQIDLKVETDRLELMLQPGPQLQLVLADRSLLEVGQQLYVELSLMNGEEETDSWWIAFKDSPEAERKLSLAGEYRLRLYVASVDEDGGWTWLPYPREDGMRVQVQDVSGVQTIRLPWTASEVQADIEARAAGK
ncbi:MAG: hypothetical protein O3A20_00380, partial [Planctomycetota bacterium]|nr:hypothetical protein [Planctomycetota bacterium]